MINMGKQMKGADENEKKNEKSRVKEAQLAG